MKTCGFNFDTTYIAALPPPFFTKLKPQPAANPAIVMVNEALAASIGLDFSDLSEKERADLFSGNQLPENSTFFAQAYAGHQFGHFTLLGDGRAHLWGEHVTPAGKRFDIQFKGAGRTPYSRNGDGKAALGPMLREYIISEALYHLGIPTTRSLAVVTTGEPVMREEVLPGAILTRVASSHIRVGTFEFAATRQDKDSLQALLDYTINRHYPEFKDSKNKALSLLAAVMERQVDLIVHWMRVGFIHGVMNTDNMTLSGETIDYGPCAFMDRYDPGTVFSSIDRRGRYAYANQPRIAQWNLARLADTLLPLIDEDIDKAVSLAEETLGQFPDLYQQKFLATMCAKLGLFEVKAGDAQLISDLLDWMYKNNADYTNSFRDLMKLEQPDNGPYKDRVFGDWWQSWQERLRANGPSSASASYLMKSSNPAVIPRNHKVEQALEAAHTGDLAPFKELLAVLQNPYSDEDHLKPYQAPPEPGEQVYQTFCGT